MSEDRPEYDAGNEDEQIECETAGWTFVQIPISIVEDNDLSNSAFRVFCAMVRYAGVSKIAWPSQRTLAENLGVTTRTIRAALKELLDRNWIEVVERRYNDSTKYRLNALPDRKKTSKSDLDRKESSKSTGKNLPPNDIHRTDTDISASGDAPTRDDILQQSIPKIVEWAQDATREEILAVIESESGSKRPRASLLRKLKGMSRPGYDELVLGLVRAWKGIQADEREKLDLFFSTGKVRKLIHGSASTLYEYGVRNEDIEPFYEYFMSQHWKGQKRQRPAPSDIVESWPDYEEFKGNGGARDDGIVPAGEAKWSTPDEW